MYFHAESAEFAESTCSARAAVRDIPHSFPESGEVPPSAGKGYVLVFISQAITNYILSVAICLHTPSEPAALVPLTQVDIAECPEWQHERSECPLRILRIPRENIIVRETKTSARKIHAIHEIRGAKLICLHTPSALAVLVP